jgi:hypothetical protein
MPQDDGRIFGCASNGFCSNEIWAEPEENGFIFWKHQPKGEVLSGTYSDIIEKLKRISFQPAAAIVVFAKSVGMEDFIEKIREIKGDIPMLGGAAALGDNQTSGEILPKAEEAALLLIQDEGYVVEFCNIHTEKDEKVAIQRIGNRFISRVKTDYGGWQDSLEFFRLRQKSRGMDENDFETLTFSDAHGRNLHCSASGTGLKTGADLPDGDILIIRETDHNKAAESISSFLSTEDALICGCAGLRSLLDRKLYTGNESLAGFLFGEVVTIGQRPMFGNLMLAKIKHKD